MKLMQQQLPLLLDLCKLRIVALLVFTALVGMALAVAGSIPWQTMLLASVGIGLGAAAGAVLNHWADYRIDRLMARTRHRPLPQGGVSRFAALAFALVLTCCSMLILGLGVNMLTALLTLLSLVGYGAVYTIFLKYMTPQNIVIGGVTGAAPPLLGWTAITGSLEAEAMLLFLIIFVWTPPHFWSLALDRHQDYARAAVPMLPVTHGLDFTKLQVLLYSWLLLAVSVLPYVVGMSGLLYLLVALVLGAVFVGYATRLYRAPDLRLAIPTFRYSIVYLGLLFLGMLLDHGLWWSQAF